MPPAASDKGLGDSFTGTVPAEELAAQIADAPAPFWEHVRALAERHP